MKLLAVLGLLAVAAAAPAVRSNDNLIDKLLFYSNDIQNSGSYRYAYETSDGSKAQQVGQIRNEGTKEEILVVSGSFEWRAPNGIFYTVIYTADENGYKPEVEEGPGGLPAACVASCLG